MIASRVEYKPIPLGSLSGKETAHHHHQYPSGSNRAGHRWNGRGLQPNRAHAAPASFTLQAPYRGAYQVAMSHSQQVSTHISSNVFDLPIHESERVRGVIATSLTGHTSLSQVQSDRAPRRECTLCGLRLLCGLLIAVFIVCIVSSFSAAMTIPHAARTFGFVSASALAIQSNSENSTQASIPLSSPTHLNPSPAQPAVDSMSIVKTLEQNQLTVAVQSWSEEDAMSGVNLNNLCEELLNIVRFRSGVADVRFVKTSRVPLEEMSSSALGEMTLHLHGMISPFYEHLSKSDETAHHMFERLRSCTRSGAMAQEVPFVQSVLHANLTCFAYGITLQMRCMRPATNDPRLGCNLRATEGCVSSARKQIAASASHSRLRSDWVLWCTVTYGV